MLASTVMVLLITDRLASYTKISGSVGPWLIAGGPMIICLPLQSGGGGSRARNSGITSEQSGLQCAAISTCIPMPIQVEVFENVYVCALPAGSALMRSASVLKTLGALHLSLMLAVGSPFRGLTLHTSRTGN